MSRMFKTVLFRQIIQTNYSDNISKSHNIKNQKKNTKENGIFPFT